MWFTSSRPASAGMAQRQVDCMPACHVSAHQLLLLMLSTVSNLQYHYPSLQMGAESVVRSLARRGLEVVGQLPPSSSGGAAASSGAPGSSGSGWSSGAPSPPLMGTPLEPYANPTHPSARPDTTPNILAGNPLEEYANPSPQWQQAASAAAAALAQADAQLPPSSLPVSGGSSGGGSSGGGNGRTAAAVAGTSGQTSGLGPSARVQPLLQRLQRFMEEHVYPAGGG